MGKLAFIFKVFEPDTTILFTYIEKNCIKVIENIKKNVKYTSKSINLKNNFMR